MKRLWIGVGLLAAILLVGLWTSGRMERVHTRIACTLTDSAQAARDGRWEQAEELARQAEESWQHSWNFSAALADHTVLDEIDALFAQAEAYRRSRQQVDYEAVCARLASAIDALQEGHKLSWWNLL